MDQNDTTIKEVAFFNKPSTRIGIVAIIASLVWGYFSNINPMLTAQKECPGQIDYVPTQDAIDGTIIKKSAIAEHYTWKGQKFESREAAENTCFSSYRK